MARLLERLTAAERCVWLDDRAYAERLLAAGKQPCLAVSDYVAFRTQASSLLHSDVLPLPVGPICAAWLDAHPELLERMGQKQRVGAPLRAMLGDPALRDHLVAIARALGQALGDKPLVLELPAPRTWIDVTHARCGLAALEVDQAGAEKAAVYVAEFLRAFAECYIDGIVLVEDASQATLTAQRVTCYQPVLNIAEHYRWTVGVRVADGVCLNALPDGVAFVIAATQIASLPTVRSLPHSIWSDPVLPADVGGCVYAELPVSAEPARVLETIDALLQR